MRKRSFSEHKRKTSPVEGNRARRKRQARFSLSMLEKKSAMRRLKEKLRAKYEKCVCCVKFLAVQLGHNRHQDRKIV